MKALIATLALFALSGCISTLEGAYDEQARNECDRETTARERGACHDRVEQNRRDNR